MRQSRMSGLGSAAPDFALPDVVTGDIVRLDDFADAPGLLVAFLCNHCPYVKHMLDGFAAFAREYQPLGLAVVAISSNDVADYPEDAPEHMAVLARERRFSFPYLYDESQDVALAFDAICTPDFFMFDAARRLYYAGQFDASRPKRDLPVTGGDMRQAADALLAGLPPPMPQRPSAGCGIKWKRNKQPAWA